MTADERVATATQIKAQNYIEGATAAQCDRVEQWVAALRDFKAGYAAEPSEPREPCPPVWRWKARRRWRLAFNIAELEAELGLTLR